MLYTCAKPYASPSTGFLFYLLDHGKANTITTLNKFYYTKVVT